MSTTTSERTSAFLKVTRLRWNGEIGVWEEKMTRLRMSLIHGYEEYTLNGKQAQKCPVQTPTKIVLGQSPLETTAKRQQADGSAVRETTMIVVAISPTQLDKILEPLSL